MLLCIISVIGMHIVHM